MPVERVGKRIVCVDTCMTVEVFGAMKSSGVVVISAGHAAFHISVEIVTPSVAVNMGFGACLGGGVAILGVDLPLITASGFEVPGGLLGRGTQRRSLNGREIEARGRV